MIDKQQIEKTLWSAADKLRSNMDAAEYKHIVLGLIFLKYISDAFIELNQKLKERKNGYAGANPEDPDEYLAENIFYVPEKARWTFLVANAQQPEIGTLIDQAMDIIEKNNGSLKGVLPKNYANPDLDRQRLGELIYLINKIGFGGGHAGRDILGQVYEYFLGMFAAAEGKNGGQFYTPKSIVALLVEMLEPYKGRIYDGCCGSGGMFVQSEKFIEIHQGKIDDVSIYGQESNPTTVKLAKMNLAIRGIDANIQFGDTFTNDLHPSLKADYIIANPPFNISDWKGEQLRNDERWKYGVPPMGNANFAWLQHFINKLSPKGTAGIVLANGSLNSSVSNEGEIRKNMVEARLVDCIVMLPANLFYNTSIGACLWFLAKNKTNDKFRNRENEILFIDARKMGKMTNKRNRLLEQADISMISNTYHKWRNKSNEKSARYEDIAGFCKSATLEDVRHNNYVLMPGIYVGTEDKQVNDTPFDEKMQSLMTRLAEQFAKDNVLENIIRENLKGIGYEF